MKKILLGFVLLLQIGFCEVSFANPYGNISLTGESLESPYDNYRFNDQGEIINTQKDPYQEASNNIVKEIQENSKKPPKYTVHIDSFEKGGEDITGEDGIDLITKYIAFFYKAIAGIIGLICVLIVAVSGVQISLGGLSPEGVNQAKDRIIQALLSMALLFSSAAILKAINGGFFT